MVAEALRPLEFLIGTWRGEGVGAIPGGGGPDYPYVEELRIYEDGSPWLAYSSRVTAAADGRWLHSEAGWWRPQPADESDTIGVELVLTRATGVTEILIGHLTTGPVGDQIELASDVVARTPTAPAFTADKRLYAVRGGKLMYAIDLAAGDSGLAPHLAAALDRAED
ncbi:MAG: FABP family protein [Frankiaceae bacterium]|nr:FABP family protein [Frankiaceae bacterium]MBV9871478.1 FABP family protein [Frankiaceae bacterium]